MIGGAVFVTGMLLMAYNTYRTIRAAKASEYEAAALIPVGVAH
jgi:cytochrome c oxidase cbb3-type subunit 1